MTASQTLSDGVQVIKFIYDDAKKTYEEIKNMDDKLAIEILAKKFEELLLMGDEQEDE